MDEQERYDDEDFLDLTGNGNTSSGFGFGDSSFLPSEDDFANAIGL